MCLCSTFVLKYTLGNGKYQGVQMSVAATADDTQINKTMDVMRSVLTAFKDSKCLMSAADLKKARDEARTFEAA